MNEAEEEVELNEIPNTISVYYTKLAVEHYSNGRFGLAEYYKHLAVTWQAWFEMHEKMERIFRKYRIKIGREARKLSEKENIPIDEALAIVYEQYRKEMTKELENIEKEAQTEAKNFINELYKKLTKNVVPILVLNVKDDYGRNFLYVSRKYPERHPRFPNRLRREIFSV